MTGALVTVSGVSSEGSAAFETPLFEFYRDPDIAAFAEGFYDDPPQKLTVVRNWLSSREIAITDKETIAEFFGALSQIRVGEAAAAPSSDSDTHYCFSYADGSEYTFSFNASGLMISTDEHPYQQCFRGSGGEDLGALTNQLFEQ